MPVPSQERELSCIYVLDSGIDLFSFYDFYIGCLNCYDSVVFFIFHFIIKINIGILVVDLRGQILFFTFQHLNKMNCSTIQLTVLQYLDVKAEENTTCRT